MSQDPAVKSHCVRLDNNLDLIPGVAATNGLSGDQFPFILNTGTLDFVNGTTAAVSFPFPCQIIGASLEVFQALGTSAGTIEIGVVGTLNQIVASTAVGTGAAPNNVALALNSDVTKLQLAANTPIIFTASSGATSTGKGIASITVIPGTYTQPVIHDPNNKNDPNNS